MKQKILFLILAMFVLCFTGTGSTPADGGITGALPSETALERGQLYDAESRSSKSGALRAPGSGGSGGIDTGDQTGDQDETGTRNDAPAGEAMVVLILASIVYGLIRRTRIAKNAIENKSE